MLNELTAAYQADKASWRLTTPAGDRAIDLAYLDTRSDVSLDNGIPVSTLRNILERIPTWNTWFQQYLEKLDAQEPPDDDDEWKCNCPVKQSNGTAA